MGALGKSFGKILDVAKPLLGAVNPMLGAAAGAVGGLAQGKNPLESILGGVGDLIPGGAGGIFKNLLSAFGGGGMMDGAGGNNLLSGLLGMVTGKGGVTDLLGGLTKGVEGTGGLSDLGLKNVQEQAAQKMGSLLGGLFG